MSADLLEQFCRLATEPRELSVDERAQVVMAFEDTWAVAHAGWHQRVVEAARRLYAGDRITLLDGSRAASADGAAFIHAVAGHALDFDDCETRSAAHPSTVIVPALLAVQSQRRVAPERLIVGFAVGLAVNSALGRALGFAHWEHGWHPTGTIGPISGALAVAYLLGLSDLQIRHAVSLAIAQAAGMQRNLGTDAKPLHAGFAAGAAVRSALLAEAGATADPNGLGPRGFLDLYDGAGEPADSIEVAIDVHRLSRKLYPCCYAAHRLIAAAQQIRAGLERDLPDTARIEVSVPYGTMSSLRVSRPSSGLEAKFCAAYCTAVALEQGWAGLDDFTDHAVQRASIRNLMERIVVREEERDDGGRVGFDSGTVRIDLIDEGRLLGRAALSDSPGSPAMPFTPEQHERKIGDCLAFYSRQSDPVSIQDFREGLQSAMEPRG